VVKDTLALWLKVP